MVSCIYQGRAGNQWWQAAMLISYALKHDISMDEICLPTIAYHCDGHKVYFPDLPFKKCDKLNLPFYDEPRPNDIPYYYDIPKMDNVIFRGYWQSFKYIDEYREDILRAFKIPYEMVPGVVGLHVRLGDYLQLTEFKLALAPLEYYQKAVRYFYEMGYFNFRVFSDEIPKCRDWFTSENFPGCRFTFSEGRTEVEDLSDLSSMEHQVVAHSTFSFVAAWLNRNPDKIVICPAKDNLFKGANEDMIPENWIQIKF